MLHSIAFLLLCSNIVNYVIWFAYSIVYNTKEKDIYKYISKKKSITNQLKPNYE